MQKKETTNKPPKAPSDGSGISTPYNVKVQLTVDENLNWDASSPDDIFTIKQQIGRGAYGTVYKAALKATGYVIAAKRVVEDDKGKSTIKKEVDILRKCNHNNIVNYFGCIEGKDPKEPSDAKGGFKYPDASEKSLWILMDFCGGGSVKDYIEAKGPLKELQIGAILIGVIQGLAYLHSQKIIHRDLKAANILTTMEGGVKIADFGISTQINATVTGNAKTMIGTTYWMAPEILSESYNHKIDIWSLGITAIELAEGTPPNYNLKPFQMMLKLPKDPPPTMKNPEKFSKEFVALTSQCLQKVSDKRPEAKDLLSSEFLTNQLKVGVKALTDAVVAIAKRS